MITRITLTDISNIITETVNRLITEFYYDTSLDVANACKNILKDIFTHWCMIKYCEKASISVTTISHWNTEINEWISVIISKMSKLKNPSTNVKAFNLMMSENSEFMPDANGTIDYESALRVFNKKYQSEAIGLKLPKLDVNVAHSVFDDWSVYVKSSFKDMLIGESLSKLSKFKKK